MSLRPPGPHAATRPLLLRLAPRGSSLRTLALLMVGLGVAMGLAFPVFVAAIGVATPAQARSTSFRVASLVAGVLVGGANHSLVRGVVGRRLRALALRMHTVGELVRMATASGDWSPLQGAASRVPVGSDDDLGEPARAFNAVIDALDESVTERHRLEDRLRYQALHDALTGLANRELFGDRLAHALELRRRDPAPLAVLYLDLDGFKGVNDSFGHAVGDELLIRAAERLRGAVRSGDTVARFGGDEFAVLLEQCDRPAEMAWRLVESFRVPFVLAERTLTLSVSIGVADLPVVEEAPNAAVLLARADMAMYAVKRRGKNDFHVHTPDLRLDEVDDATLHRALTAALRTGDLTAQFQPVVEIATGSVRGFEVLARWWHDGRFVPPSVFVPVAERGGLIASVTDAMLDTALDAVDGWDLADHPDLYVAVNISRHELARAELPRRVEAALARHGQPGHRLVLEVTESGLILDAEAARETLTRVRRLGARIALDDFGTGYNSLVQLLNIPLDILKIDRMFIQGIDHDLARVRLFDGLLSVAEGLSMHVIVEGVETPEELAHLRGRAVSSAQGFLLGVPVDARSAGDAVRASSQRRLMQTGA